MPTLTRRRFLSALVVAASASVLPALPVHARDDRRVSRTLFPQSVASGDPRPDRVLLWTRVASTTPLALRLQVAEDAGFERLRVDRVLPETTGSDGCIKVRVEDLAPSTTYHYRFVAGDGAGAQTSPHGRTRTAPAPSAAVATPVKVLVLMGTPRRMGGMGPARGARPPGWGGATTGPPLPLNGTGQAGRPIRVGGP